MVAPQDNEEISKLNSEMNNESNPDLLQKAKTLTKSNLTSANEKTLIKSDVLNEKTLIKSNVPNVKTLTKSKSSYENENESESEETLNKSTSSKKSKNSNKYKASKKSKTLNKSMNPNENKLGKVFTKRNDPLSDEELWDYTVFT